MIDWILTCGWKWVLALLAPLGAFGGMLAFAFIFTAALFAPIYGVTWLLNRFAPRTMRSMENYQSRVSKKIPPWAFILAMFLALGVAFAPQIVSKSFGCDDCLPESMREKCEADRKAVEARDRAQFLALCERWNWAECPAAPDNSKVKP